jgi:hypothetical protein
MKKLVGIFAINLSYCFTEVYASRGNDSSNGGQIVISAEALVEEAEAIVDNGIESLLSKWSLEAVSSFRNSAEQCKEKLNESLPYVGSEQLLFMSVRIASILRIIQELDEFSEERDSNRKEHLQLIAYNSDSRLRSFILARLHQIEESRGRNREQLEGRAHRINGGGVPPMVSAGRRASPEVVKGKNSEKIKK